MFIKLLIASVILVAFVILALGVKLWFDPKAEFSAHSCALEDDDKLDEDQACSKCQLKDLANCPENKNNQV
ncbi:hypothetical protein [Sunxiuqinia dokdonensis]|uniref:Membrane or secreted protein n=1 Tax=Sunxiuqinia dokdonensis TaxID=1409788 RepID=A0A0L8V5S3_9BACT|nr:hypothetical protein [Sunxiuqinia dokdonensis]KOH43688.1 hypothetical protein NC99_34570 [Sunxiuqinia dokdonensis]|tara:strand:- start:26 stop:238 length:213 start_codon:yes stop_codon:yes gene_type:complete